MSFHEPDSSVHTPLQDHFQQCLFAAGPLHRLQCVAEAMTAFVAPRLVSVLVVITFVLGMAWSLRSGVA